MRVVQAIRKARAGEMIDGLILFTPVFTWELRLEC